MTVEQLCTVSIKPCPICGSKQLKVFFEMADIPVHCNLLWQSREEARNCPRGDIKLAFCPVCSFITNLAFDPFLLEYSEQYENSLFYSSRFQEYASLQAARLIERYDLKNKDIIEIGCGKGDFLLLLCKLGNNRGVGFDPTYVEQQKHIEVMDRVNFIRDFYSERYKDYQANLIVCRHVLEHIPNPKEFLIKLLRTIIDRTNTYVFFEVPNALNIFHKLSVWDIIYEHCSYFTPISLALTFSSCGFHVCELTEDYDGQFICIDAIPEDQNMINFKHEQKSEVDRIANYIRSYAANYRTKVMACRNTLKQQLGREKSAVIWGAGSKGVTFLNTLKDLQIEYAVDINPRKQEMYIPGTGQKIVPPEFLQDYQPNVVIVMNPIYDKEIRETTKRLGITTNFIYV